MILIRSSYKYTLLIVLFAISNFGYSQTETEDITLMKMRLNNETDSLKKVGLYNDIAWEYSLSNYDSSLLYTQKAIQLSNNLASDYWKAVSLEMMALLKEISGQVEEAAQLYMEVIALREKIGGEGLETTYNNLGILFQSQEDYKKALVYYRKSYVIELQNNNEEGIAGSLINMHILLTSLGEVDSSFILLKEALAIVEKNDMSYIKSSAYLGMAKYYLKKDQLDSALYYCKQIIDSNDREIDAESIAIALQNTSDIYFKKGKYQLALEYLNRAEIELSKLNSLILNAQLYASKAETLAALGLYAQAYKSLLKHRVAKDSLINKETITVLHNLEKKYETEKKERQIIELQLLGSKSKNERNIFILMICFVVLGVIFLFILLRSKSKANAIISTSLLEKETLLKEIHHRVKNNLQVISSLLSLQSRYIEDKNAKSAVKEGQNRVKSMALIHQKLYQKNNLTGIDMKDYVQNLLDNLFASYGISHKKVVLTLAIDAIRLDVDTAIPLGLILNELVSNAFKHAFKKGKGKLLIQLVKQESALVLTVKDDGKGFDKHDKTPLPTESKGEDGFGMRLIDSLSRKLKATILVDGSEGTTYKLIIKNFKLV